jgi:hypothetical protein
MSRPYFFYLCVLQAVTVGLRAQTPADIPPPHAPLVAPVPDHAQWTITLDYGEANKAGTNSPSAAAKEKNPETEESLQQIQSVKAGNLKQDLLVSKNGKTTQVWYADQVILSPGPAGDILVGNARGLEVDANVTGIFREVGKLTESFGFPGVDWLNLKYYDKVVLLGLTPCYHYILQGGGVIAAEAWINAKTNLPVEYGSEGITYTYAFGPAPENVVMPPAYAAAYAKYHQMQTYSDQLMKDAAKAMQH